MKRSLFAALWWLMATAPSGPADPAPAPIPDSLARVSRDTTSAARDSTVLPFRLIPRGEIASQGNARGQVVEPAGIACDPFGRVWVSDAQLHKVQRFERDGRWLGEMGLLGSGEGELRRPGSIAALGAADMGVLDQENRRVLDYDLFGRLEGTRIDLQDPALENLVGRVDPTALATDRGGAVYVVDPARERVPVFDAGGRFERALGEFGSKPGQFRGLQGLGGAPRRAGRDRAPECARATTGCRRTLGGRMVAAGGAACERRAPGRGGRAGTHRRGRREERQALGVRRRRSSGRGTRGARPPARARLGTRRHAAPHRDAAGARATLRAGCPRAVT